MKGTDLDFSCENSQAWKLVLVILERSRPSSKFSNDWTVALWVLDLFQEDIREFCPSETLFWVFLFCIDDERLCARILDIRPEAADVTRSPGGFTVIHAKIAENFPTVVMGSFKMLARRGVDLHRVGTTTDYGAETLQRPISDTPTSMAMRRSLYFDRWRHVLKDAGADLTAFVGREVRDGPLREQGWTVETLLQLFEFEYEPHLTPETLCHICGREVYRLYASDEAWWERLKSSVLHVHGREASDDEGSDGDTFYSFSSSEDNSTSRPQDPLDSEPYLFCWKCEMMKEVRDESRASGSAKFATRVP